MLPAAGVLRQVVEPINSEAFWMANNTDLQVLTTFYSQPTHVKQMKSQEPETF